MADILQFPRPVLRDGAKARIKRRRLLLGVAKVIDIANHHELVGDLVILHADRSCPAIGPRRRN